MSRLELRPEPSRAMMLASPLIAAVAMLLTGSLLFLSLGQEPLHAFYVYFIKPASTVYGVGELLLKATPLILCGIGLAIGFRANVANIGADGQLTMGAIAAGAVALYFDDVQAGWLLPLMIVAGALGGMAWAAIPALLRTRFNASEILTSLMLTYVAQQILIYLVTGPWKDPEGYGFPQSRLFSEWATLPILVPETRVHLGVAIAFLAVLLAWGLLAKTMVGFQLKVVGQAPRAARYAGFSQTALIWLALLIGGGAAGLAGLLEVASTVGQLTPQISPGYGFTAIIVAFLGRLHPVGILFAALVLALSYLGGEAAQIQLGLPNAATGIFQGILLFFLLGCDILILYRIRLRRRVPAVAKAAARGAAA